MAGKVDPGFLAEVIFPALKAGGELLWGPKVGGDFAVLRLGNGVLVAATDPLALSPELGWSRAGWLAFHLVATDAAASGIPPSFLLASWAVPESMDDAALREALDAFHAEARKFSVRVIGGHTGRYPDAAFPWVGAATCLGWGREEELLLPNSARPGDGLFLFGSLGLEAAVLLAFTERDGPARAWAEENFSRLSGLSAALAAARVPGVRALHDVTEGGLIGALEELSSAAGLGLAVELGEVVVEAEVREVLSRHSLDPLTVTSMGCLLALATSEAEEALVASGFRRIGEGVEGEGVRLTRQGRPVKLPPQNGDPFWRVFAERQNKEV